MSRSIALLDVPQRIPLAVQTAASLRVAVRRGAWTGFLPGERRLCRLLQVSRPTLRRALHILADEKLVEIHPGRRNRLLTPPRRSRTPTQGLVCLVFPEPVSHMPLATYNRITELRALLADANVATETVVCPRENPREERRKLEAFLRENVVSCCVLMSVSRELQQWCGKRALPAVIVGSCHRHVRLPSLAVDYRSVCRHAAGVFLRHGHQRIAMVVPNTGAAGDLASEDGFSEGMAAGGARALIVRHDGTAEGITARLDALFKGPRAPTALLVAKPGHVLAVIIYLLKRGLAVPNAVSLIARDQDILFESVHPAISHYEFEGDSFVQPLVRMILKRARGERLPEKPVLIFPRFVAGGTVGPAVQP